MAGGGAGGTLAERDDIDEHRILVWSPGAIALKVRVQVLLIALQALERGAT